MIELLISGQRAIDVMDWEAHTEYSAGYTAQSPQIQWFWHAVKSQLNAEGTAPYESAFHDYCVSSLCDVRQCVMHQRGRCCCSL